MEKQYTVIDLFCGCGGLSYGFEMAGYKTLLGIDNWEDALKTFKRNHLNANALNADLSKLTGEKILDFLSCKKEEIDIIIGGPPCQGFSISGKRDLKDPRNKLYKSFVQIVGFMQPKAFLMENVPGLIKLFDGQVKEEIIRDFENVGYRVSCKVLNAADYGVPQMRKRVIFVGLKARDFEFPEPTYGIEFNRLPYITCLDAISDLSLLEDEPGNEISQYHYPVSNDYQRLMREGSDSVYNHLATLHKPQTTKIISLVPDGGSYKDLPEEYRYTRRVNIAWTRMNSMKPCFTIDTGHNHHFHYKANRVPTTRESARIQSFPDRFVFECGKTSQLRQVGNAVPPLLGRVLADKIKYYLDEV
ncbi:MAG: DNA cytosine methyltransferase [Ruminiclostridium sp.]